MSATGAGCSNALHDWKNRCCHACGFYGWLPPTRPAEPKVADDE